MSSEKQNAVGQLPAKQDTRRTRRHPYRRKLALEALEDRQLLANLILGIQLWTDGGGASGEPVKGDLIEPVNGVYEVTKGSTFVIQILAEDDRTTGENRGIISLPLDLEWNTGGTEIIRAADGVPPLFPDSIPSGQSWVTTQFNRQRFVNEFDSATGAEALRGGTIPVLDGTDPIGVRGQDPPWGTKDDWREFSRLRFSADTVGTSDIRAVLAGSMSFADADPLDNAVPPPAAIAQIRVVQGGRGSLSGFVYVDADKDGVRGEDANGAPTEAGLPKVEIELYRDGVFVQSDHTGPDGWYHFEDLQPGTYEIRQPTQPSCFLDGTESLGIILPSNESRGTAGNDAFTGIELGDGEAGIDYNFGELGLKASCINKGMLLGSANLRQATVNDPLGVPSAVVRGTDQDDTIRVTIDTAAIRVTVNDGTPQTFTFPEVQVVTVDGLGGQDNVTVTGSAADEVGHVQPGSAVYRNDVCYPEPSTGTRCDWDWALEVLHAENVAADAAAGRDLAVFRDSTGDDTLTAEGNRVVFGFTEQELEVLAMERVRAFSTRGGNDVVEVTEPLDFELESFGDWTSA